MLLNIEKLLEPELGILCGMFPKYPRYYLLLWAMNLRVFTTLIKVGIKAAVLFLALNTVLAGIFPPLTFLQVMVIAAFIWAR